MNPTIEILPARPLSSSPELVDVVLRITPPTPEDHLPAPVDLALVIDTSGSMGGRPLHLAQEAARQTIRALHPTDRLTLVTFASGATMLTPLLPVADGTHLLRAVDRLQARGSTALHAGWQLGAGLLNSALHPSRLPSVLLVTDGRANVGVINPATIAVDVAQSLGQGVSTSTVGVGTRYDEHLLEYLAEAGDGNYAFAETPEALSASFLSELKALRATVCRMARLSVSGPRITDLLNDLPRLADGRLALPPLRAGRPLDVLLQVSAQAGEQLTLQLDWTGLDGQTRTMEVTHTFAAVLPGQEAQDDPEVVHLRAGLVAARAQREMARSLDHGDVHRALTTLNRSRDQLRRSHRDGAPLQADLKHLDELERRLKQGELTSASKLAKALAYRRQTGRDTEE